MRDVGYEYVQCVHENGYKHGIVRNNTTKKAMNLNTKIEFLQGK